RPRPVGRLAADAVFDPARAVDARDLVRVGIRRDHQRACRTLHAVGAARAVLNVAVAVEAVAVVVARRANVVRIRRRAAGAVAAPLRDLGPRGVERAARVLRAPADGPRGGRVDLRGGHEPAVLGLTVARAVAALVDLAVAVVVEAIPARRVDEAGVDAGAR